MNLLQRFLQRLILSSLPVAMIDDVVYDFLVIHDDPNVENITLVIYNNKRYGLIRRDRWNQPHYKEEAALDSPELAAILLAKEELTRKETPRLFEYSP